jgi:hypothetical protein
VLMPSTRFAYPQVVSRIFASFRVAKFSIPAGDAVFWGGVRFPAAPPGRTAAEMRPFWWIIGLSSTSTAG